MSSILEFLIELDEKKSLEMISQCYSQKSTLFFKTEASPHMIRATINSLSDKKVILHIEPADAAIKLETEVYFIKAPIKSYLNNYYFDFSATVIQQKRRREPRYQILKKWSQAEVTCEALVRFCSSRDGQGPIAGLEFVQLRPVQQEKISSIVEDLIQHTVMTKV